MRNFPCFNVGDYIDILHLKRLHMNYDNLFMFQSHPRSLKQVFRTGGKIKGLAALQRNVLYNIYFFYVSEAKHLCFSLCSQMFDDVERC